MSAMLCAEALSKHQFGKRLLVFNNFLQVLRKLNSHVNSDIVDCAKRILMNLL